MPVNTWLVDIAPERCLTLLERATLGRLAVIIRGRPEIYPINHVYDRVSQGLAFPTRPGTKLDGILDWPSVAYEIDGVEPDNAGGWSVAVVGAPREITDPTEIERLTRLRHIPWVANNASRWIRIVPSKITGRRISAIKT